LGEEVCEEVPTLAALLVPLLPAPLEPISFRHRPGAGNDLATLALMRGCAEAAGAPSGASGGQLREFAGSLGPRD